VSNSQLVLHCGARSVSESDLLSVPVPEPTRSWYPVPHGAVLTVARETLHGAGYEIAREELSLSRNDARFFGVLDLKSLLLEGVALTVGIRSSLDKSLPLGLVGGSRTFVCDNLSFYGNLLEVKRKHSRFGAQRFATDIQAAIGRLSEFRRFESKRLEVLQATEATTDFADAFILRAFERGLVPQRAFMEVVREWREPSHAEFQPRTLYSLLNAFTGVLTQSMQRDPGRWGASTVRLNALLLDAPGVRDALRGEEFQLAT
jgi:hypothetical protein